MPASGFVTRFKGRVKFDAIITQSVGTVAPAGTTRTDATLLTNRDNVILGTVTAGTGVVLANLQAGQAQRLWARTGTIAVTVYAQGTTTIDGTAGSTGVAMTAPKAVEFFCESTGVIVSAALGAVSS